MATRRRDTRARSIQIERRVYRTEFRDVPGSKGRQKWATAVTYNTVDDYGTIWLPGCFDKSLGERMPTMLYGHDWYSLDHVLGKGVDFRQSPGAPGVDVLLEFDDPEFVPMVRQAMWQVDNKTLQDVSVGFDRWEWLEREKLTPEQLKAGASEAMVEAGMDELSIVVRGAVTGASFRNRRTGSLDIDAVMAIAKRKVAGEITEEEAQAALDLLAGTDGGAGAGAGGSDDDDTAGGGGDGGAGDESPPPDLDAEIDAALESIGRSRRT